MESVATSATQSIKIADFDVIACTCTLLLKLLQLYGTETTDCHRPALVKHGIPLEAQEHDKAHSDVLKSGKARGFIKCTECGKPRCVYSMTRLSLDQVSCEIILKLCFLQDLRSY